MERQNSKESHATFNGGSRHQMRNTQPQVFKEKPYDDQATLPILIDARDFQTFEPRTELRDDSSNTSSVAVPRDLTRRLDREMHLMIDDLEMPNQSMSMSSLNQSPWQGRSTRSYLSSVSNQLVGGIGGPQSSVESSNLPSARQLDSNSNLTISNSQSQFGTEEKNTQIREHDDSPDFNRAQELVSVTDDLTVSHTDFDGVTDYGGGKSYREGKLERVQPPLLKNQNRTFADSVLDHHTINALAHPKNIQTAMKSGAMSRIEPRISGNSMIRGNSKGLENDGMQLLQNERRHGVKMEYTNESGDTTDDHILDSSGMCSDLDLLTRTQISNNLGGIDPNARSRIIYNPISPEDLSQSQITIPGSDPSSIPFKKRNNNQVFRKMVDDASSLNFTPDKDSAAQSGASIKWQLKSNQGKDGTDLSDLSQLNTDRAESVNPISQLKERIKQSNIQKRQGSKGRDTELYEALETPQAHQNNYSNLQRSLNDLQTQNQELADQNRQLAKTCDVYAQQLSELQQQANQNVKPGGNELLRARALEAARHEIKELREIDDERQLHCTKLEHSNTQFEQSLRRERQERKEQVDQFELQLEKLKILGQAQRREADERVEQALKSQQQHQQSKESISKQFEFLEAQSEQRIQMLEARFQQSEQHVQSRDLELQKREKSLSKACQEIQRLESSLLALQREFTDQQRQNQALSVEIEGARQRNSDNHSLKLTSGSSDTKSREFDQEMRRVNEKNSLLLQKQVEETQKFKQMLRDRDQTIKQLQRTDAPESSQKITSVLNELSQIVGCSQDQLVYKITSLLQDMRSLSEEVDYVKELLSQKDIQIQNVNSKLQYRETELKLATEAAQKAQQSAAQANSEQSPSNFAKSMLHAKDIELQNVKESLNEALEKIWALEQDVKVMQTKLEQSINEKHEMSKELMVVRKAKNLAEQNVTDLKEKLRIELSKPSQEQMSIHSMVSADKQKYDDLINAVLGINLAVDPLSSVLKLQESFIDEFEQAMTHLDEQSKLVKTQISSLNKSLVSSKQITQESQVQNEKLSKEIAILSAKRNELQAELRNSEEVSERQAEVIQDLEKRILGKTQGMTEEIFLKILNQVVNNKTNHLQPTFTHISEQKKEVTDQLYSQISEIVDRLRAEEAENDISQILGDAPNPLHEKSGKAEASMFLSHLKQKTRHQHCQTETEHETSPALSQMQLEAKVTKQRETIQSLRFELQQKQDAVEDLKQQVMSELQLKSDELQIESDSIGRERLVFERETKEMRKNFEGQIKSMAEDFELRTTELELEYQQKIEQDSMIQNSARSQVKSEAATTVSQLKMEVKRLKEDIERNKKLQVDKVKQLSTEFESERLQMAQVNNQNVEDLNQKAKREKKDAIDKAQTQLRSELLNKMAELRNEHARLEAEWQRERTRFEHIKQEALDKLRTEMEMHTYEQIKEARGIVERTWKKKIDERQQKFEEKTSELELRLEQAYEQHQEELKKQAKMWQQKIREYQVVDQPRQLTSTMTQVSPVQQSSRVASRKGSPVYAKQNTSRQTSPTQSQVSICNCQETGIGEQLRRQEVFIEQLKINFESELERQEGIHIENIKHKSGQAIQTFEQLVILECEKILQTIAFKQSEQPGSMVSQSKLNERRSEINFLIKQLLTKVQRNQQKDLKRSFETVKQKISIVLGNLKSQLETKYKANQHSNSAIQIEDTQSESNFMSETSRVEPQRHQLARQSSQSAEVNISNNRSPHESPHQPVRGSMQLMGQDGGNSDLKKYLEFKEANNLAEESLIGRIAPETQNSKGAVVVEVEKVVRDLQMLYETTKMAKFCRLLIGESVQSESDFETVLDQKNVVGLYRDLLNNFFRLVSKLNKASDQICQDNELYKLRLVIVNLKQEVALLKKEQSGVVTRSLVQQIIAFHQRGFSHEETQSPARVKSALEALDKLYFQISKNQFKLNQLADLFTKDGLVNTNLQEVASRCEQFTTQDQFLESSFQNKYLPAEMLSPDETAHLIANVIQKIPNKNLTVNSEDILRQALQICHDQSTLSMPALQRLPQAQRICGTVVNQPANNTIQTSTAGELSKRSRSTNVKPHLSNMPRQMLMNSGSLYQTVEPPTHFLSHANQSRNLVSIVNDRYTCSQESAMPTSMVKVPYNQTLSQETDFLIDEGESVQMTQPQLAQLDDQLANAQLNVNQLFEKLRGGKFNTLQH